MGYAAIPDVIACVNHVYKMRRVFKVVLARRLLLGPTREPNAPSSHGHLAAPRVIAMAQELARFTPRAPFV